MSREGVRESWFSNMWWSKTSLKGTSATDNEKPVIGVLTYEIANLMSKVVNLWHLLSENEINRLKEEILNSEGIQNLVSCDDVYLMDLALNEIVENFGFISKTVARFGRKCEDPHLRRFELFVSDPIQYSSEWVGWDYRLKKMEKKVKKMEGFISFSLQLSQELEVLDELEQTLRRMRANPDLERGKLVEIQQKVVRQRQEVKNLRTMSPWFRTYDYIVRLLARSLLTILERMKHAFKSHQPPAEKNHDQSLKKPDCLPRSHSFSVLLQSPVYPSDNILCGRSGSKSSLAAEKCKLNKKQSHTYQSSALQRKYPRSKTKRFPQVRSFGGCMAIGIESPILRTSQSPIGGSMRLGKDIDKMGSSNSGSFSCSDKIYIKLACFSTKGRLLNAPPSTLGDAALAVHYANVILMIENLASSPQMIDAKTRDELYRMLSSTIRTTLRVRLMLHSMAQTSSVTDVSISGRWSATVATILEWLSPLARNMTRWHSERNFERDHMVSQTNLLLVQTLYFANKAKTEAAIVDLLVGLSYICRINKQRFQEAQPELSGCRATSGHMLTTSINRDNRV